MEDLGREGYRRMDSPAWPKLSNLYREAGSLGSRADLAEVPAVFGLLLTAGPRQWSFGEDTHQVLSSEDRNGRPLFSCDGLTPPNGGPRTPETGNLPPCTREGSFLKPRPAPSLRA